MTSFEINDKIFAKAVKKFNFVDEKPEQKETYTRLGYENHERHDYFNRTDDDWKDDPLRDLQLREQGPPDPKPKYNQLSRGHKVIPIEEILEEPARSKRPEKILILIRGAPGSGKTDLAKKIMKREQEQGNGRCKFITCNRYYPKKFIRDHISNYMDNCYFELEEVVQEGFYNFIVVEVEGGNLAYFNSLTNIASVVGGFEFYSIDIIQKLEVCMKYNKHDRVQRDVEEIIKAIEAHDLSYRNKFLDPMFIIEPGYKPRASSRASSPEKTIRNFETSFKRNFSSDDDDDEDDEECFVCIG